MYYPGLCIHGCVTISFSFEFPSFTFLFFPFPFPFPFTFLILILIEDAIEYLEKVFGWMELVSLL